MKKNNKFSWVNNNLRVRFIKDYGKCVFANKDLKKDELLAIFGGHVLTRKEEDKLPIKLRDYAIQISKDHVLGVINKKEVDSSCYFNHSCNPNAGIKGQILLVSMRKIKKGEQITFDYGMVLHESKIVEKQYKLKCLCGANNCRKFITVNDWKKKDLQKKYDGYFQFYLQEKINKLKK